MRIADPKTCLGLLIVVCLACAAADPATQPASDPATQPAGDWMKDLQKLVELGEAAPASLSKSVADQIERDSSAACKFLLPKIGDAQASDDSLVVYAWALGLAKCPDAIGPIIALAEKHQAGTPAFRFACARALAQIGGEKAGSFLMSQMERASEREERFELLNLLAQMQYEPALPKALEVLKVDPDEEYWRPMFIFGKLGDLGVPALIKQIDSEERNERFNAIALLGPWLLASEAVPALQARFGKEPDAEIRTLILHALECTMPDWDALLRFAQEAAAKDQDENVRRFAQETVGQMPALHAKLKSFQEDKKIDSSQLEAEYARLYRSAGRDGSVDRLGTLTRRTDEPRLKDLRRRILQRNSDECFHEYEEVNQVILLNRHVQAPSASQPASSPSRP